MYLKSFGCSFVFGTDLKDHQLKSGYSLPSDFSYANLVAEMLGLPHQNYAQPGVGNTYILNRILHELEGPPAVFLINWTWIDRYDYVCADDQWSSILPADTGAKAKFYYSYLQSQYQDKWSTLICIKTAIDALREHHHSFLMTYTDNLIWQKDWHHDLSIDYLQKTIRPYVSDLEGMSFFDWCRHKKFAFSNTGHPLDAAHQELAQLLYNNWNDHVKS